MNFLLSVQLHFTIDQRIFLVQAYLAPVCFIFSGVGRRISDRLCGLLLPDHLYATSDCVWEYDQRGPGNYLGFYVLDLQDFLGNL